MNDWHLRRAVEVLNRGGVVLHATEGVWGLACDPDDPEAVDDVLAFKQRSFDKGLILIGADAADFAVELDAVDQAVRTQVRSTWPGPVTWVLPNRRFAGWITGGRGSVAVRVPGHPQARALCRRFGGPLVSTSANRAGRHPPRTAIQARALLRNLRRRGLVSARHPDLYMLPGETLGRRHPSEIRTVAGTLLRGTR